MSTELISAISNQLIPVIVIICVLILIVFIVIKKTFTNFLGIGDMFKGIGGFFNGIGAGIGKRISQGRRTKNTVELTDLKKKNEENKKFRAEMQGKMNELKNIFLRIEEEGKKITEMIEKSEGHIKQIEELKHNHSKFFKKIVNGIKIKKISNENEKLNNDIVKLERTINSEKEKMKEKINELLNSFKS